MSHRVSDVAEIMNSADSALPAIMFMVGAIFIAQGLYTFEQMLQVFVLLIFSVTFATQVLSNSECFGSCEIHC